MKILVIKHNGRWKLLSDTDKELSFKDMFDCDMLINIHDNGKTEIIKSRWGDRGVIKENYVANKKPIIKKPYREPR
jgi:hypothetical protein